MTNFEEEFLTTFNEHYPFERYVLKEPEAINSLFDDVYLTEVFVPSTEVDESYVGTGDFYLNPDEIYVKIKPKDGKEMRFSYFDFSEGVRDTICVSIIKDIGDYNYQSLYMEYEDEDEYGDLVECLNEEKELIKSKYGECNIKEGFDDETIINLVK